MGYRDSGRMFDALADAEGEARPQWFETSGTLNWAPPVGGVDPPDPPVTLETVSQQVKDLDHLVRADHGSALAQLLADTAAIKTKPDSSR